MSKKEIQFKFVQNWPKINEDRSENSSRLKSNRWRNPLPTLPRISMQKSSLEVWKQNQKKERKMSFVQTNCKKLESKVNEETLIENYHLPPLLLPKISESKPFKLIPSKKNNSLNPFHFDSKTRRQRMIVELEALRKKKF